MPSSGPAKIFIDTIERWLVRHVTCCYPFAEEREMGDDESVWKERAEAARHYNQQDLADACFYLASTSQRPWRHPKAQAMLDQANLVRKRIEAAERHRTMAAEHGLNDEAIDVTYEIQTMEQQLIEIADRLKSLT